MVLCLVRNETADLGKCGVDTIPFSEEECNTQVCGQEDSSTSAPTRNLIEVCEEVDETETTETTEATETSKGPDEVEDYYHHYDYGVGTGINEEEEETGSGSGEGITESGTGATGTVCFRFDYI